MKVSLYCSGQTIAELIAMSSLNPAAAKLTRGSPLMIVRRFRATHPDNPWPDCSVAPRSFGASTPAAKRHLSVSLSGCCRKSAHPDHDTIFDSFDEMSAIVSETPRLVPIDCAISYNA